MNNIIIGDTLEEMAKLEDSSFNMILCDLPYEMTASKWDKKIDLKLIWKEYKRLLKPKGSVVLFSSQPFTTELINSNRKNFKYCWYWIKNQGTNFFHAKRMPIRKVEEICVFYGGNYYPQITEGHSPTNSAIGKSYGETYHGKNHRQYSGGSTTRMPTNVLNFKCVDNYNRFHSAQKPVDLCEYLIKTYTKEGENVLDNCIGSGTTAVACMLAKRNFFGIEINEKFVEIANERIKKIQLIDKI